MQNICFEKPKRPLDEQIFGTKNKNIGMYVAKKNKYSDYLFGSQTTDEQIFRTDIRAAFDKRTNMQNKCPRTNMQNECLENIRAANKYSK